MLFTLICTVLLWHIGALEPFLPRADRLNDPGLHHVADLPGNLITVNAVHKLLCFPNSFPVLSFTNLLRRKVAVLLLIRNRNLVCELLTILVKVSLALFNVDLEK